MIFDALKFLRAYRIPHTTEGNRARRGWVQISCPFCGGGERGWDLGISLIDGRCSCWRCRGKHVVQVIRALLRCSAEEAEKIYKQHLVRTVIHDDRPAVQTPVSTSLKLPSGCEPLCGLDRHKNYLLRRNFDPDLLERFYGLRGTGPTGDYKHRIIAPITLDGRLVSYQGRDITGKVEKDRRYKACAMKDEIIHHKKILYGLDLATGTSCVVVEGITDKWRLGPGAVATFGTGFKEEQAALLYKRFRRIFVLFDPEPQAQAVAQQLGDFLANMGREVVFPDLETDLDPGDLSQDDANAVMRELQLKGWNP